MSEKGIAEIADISDSAKVRRAMTFPERPADYFVEGMKKIGQGGGFAVHSRRLFDGLAAFFLQGHAGGSVEAARAGLGVLVERGIELEERFPRVTYFRLEHTYLLRHLACLTLPSHEEVKVALSLPIPKEGQGEVRFLFHWINALRDLIAGELDAAESHLKCLGKAPKPTWVPFPDKQVVSALVARNPAKVDVALARVEKSFTASAAGARAIQGRALDVQKWTTNCFWPWADAVAASMGGLTSLDLQHDGFWIPSWSIRRTW